MKAVRTWILVADGGRARLLQNDGPGKGISSVAGTDYVNDVIPDREILSDRPGRSFDSAGEGRHAMEAPSSPQRVSKAAFAKHVMEDLESKRAAGAFDRLLIIAPPRALGDLRQHFTQKLKDALVGEVNKDWLHLRDEELVDQLGAYLAV